MKHKRIVMFLVVLVLASLACNFLTGGGSPGVEDVPASPGESGGSDEGDGPASPEEESEADEEESPFSFGGSGNFDTEFPLPEDVQNFMELDENTINYQTSMSLEEVVDFYRNEFEAEGYQERELLTVIEDGTFSLVWDGHPSGQALVVQGVDLGNGTTNVNVRLEDI